MIIWHLRAMWDALFNIEGWLALGGFSLFGFITMSLLHAEVLLFYHVLIGAMLWLWAWWLRYRLICEYRPIGEHYERL